MSVRSSIASTAHVTIANSIHGPTRNYLTRQHIRVNTARSQPLGARWSQPARPGSIAPSGMHADTGRGGGQRGARGQRAPLLWHLIVDRQPIGRDLDLGSLQWDRARAHLVVQKVHDLILLVKSRLRAGRLRPAVALPHPRPSDPVLRGAGGSASIGLEHDPGVPKPARL